MAEQQVQSKVIALRGFRRIHKWLGVPLIIFFLVIGITSILLAWKKKVELLPPTLSTRVENGTWILPSEMVKIGEEEMKKRNYSGTSLVIRVRFSNTF